MPDNFDFDGRLETSPKARFQRFLKRVVNTRYLFIAILIHLIALAIFGGMVIFEAIQTKGLFESETEVLVATPPGPPPPPPSAPPPSSEQQVDTKVNTAAKAPTKINTRISVEGLSKDFNVPPPDIPMPVSDNLSIKTDDTMREKMASSEIARMQGVRGFHEGGVMGANGRPGATGKGKQTVATFSCYVAKYSGGDWNSNFGTVADGRWYENCIYNLMLQLKRWSQDKVKANLKPEALNLADREWIEKVKPPFIFMTGHQDFKLTDAEVTNLREYLMLGGALWVDNSLPGRRSRFDIALRRELKRVLPDRDFEPIGSSHPLFSSYFKFADPPPGMNFYKEPVEVIKISGDISVVYTLNAYSDLWETGLTERDDIDKAREWSPSRRAYFDRLGHIQRKSKYQFFRNVTRDSVVTAYQFGINIVIHLITRFQDKFLTLPRSS